MRYVINAATGQATSVNLTTREQADRDAQAVTDSSKDGGRSAYFNYIAVKEAAITAIINRLLSSNDNADLSAVITYAALPNPGYVDP